MLWEMEEIKMVKLKKRDKIFISILSLVLVASVIFLVTQMKSSRENNIAERLAFQEEVDKNWEIMNKNRELGLSSKDVSLGMTAEKVREVAGEPYDIYEGDNMEMWSYEDSIVVITQGKVTMISD